MKTSRMRPPARFASWALCACLGFGLAGCLADDDGNSSDIDMFPRPNGPKILPLEESFQSIFQYAEFDSTGGEYLRLPDLPLYVTKRDSNLFGYAFEDRRKGYLLRFLDPANPDSTGIYIVGRFENYNTVILDSTPVLWLPQRPRAGVAWSLRPGQTMELITKDRDYLTEVLFPDDTAGAPITQGFQRHKAMQIRETSGDTVTQWYLRPGVGILGFERSARGRLIAAGTLKAFAPLY